MSMGRIRLYVEQTLRTPAEDVLDSWGTRNTIPFLRVFALIQMGRTARYTWEGLLDGAAPLTVFPQQRWQHFRRDIEWLTPASTSPTSWLRQITGKTGGSCPCRVGRVEMTAFDLETPRQQLAPVPVIALFEQQPSADDRILIGLHASILQGRRQIVDPDLREGWLERGFSRWPALA
jgi:hypothetical protein